MNVKCLQKGVFLIHMWDKTETLKIKFHIQLRVFVLMMVPWLYILFQFSRMFTYFISFDPHWKVGRTSIFISTLYMRKLSSCPSTLWHQDQNYSLLILVCPFRRGDSLDSCVYVWIPSLMSIYLFHSRTLLYDP